MFEAKETRDKMAEIRKNAGKLDTPKLVEELKELRELVKDQDPDPLVVKVLRLTYEYLEQNGVFNISFLEDPDASNISNLEYLLELIDHADNEYNREELRELSNVLKEQVG